jgi:hypothetical protein
LWRGLSCCGCCCCCCRRLLLLIITRIHACFFRKCNQGRQCHGDRRVGEEREEHQGHWER